MAFEIRSIAQNPKQLIVLIAAIILFIIAVISGIVSGSANARTRADYTNVMHLQQALKYYFSDQDNYPTADQYYNQRILVPQYMSSMPEVVSKGVCKDFEEYTYSQDRPTDYTLTFCLEKKVEGLAKGFHQLTEEGIQ